MGKCRVPFDTIYIRPNGLFSQCCPTWEDDSCLCRTNYDRHPWGVWNGPEFTKLRQAWISGDESLCQKCPLLASREPHVFNEEKTKHAAMMDGPRRIYVNDVNVCNLHCWTCRSHILNPDRNINQETMTREVITSFLPNANWLSLLHCGELFASQFHIDILKSIELPKYPELRVELFTNGILMPRRWNEISNIHPAVCQITMSIDGATKETYEAVRSPAKWHQIQEALQFVSRLREAGAVERFQANFVARRANFREIIPFAKMCLSHGATRIRYATFDRSWQPEDEYLAELCYTEPEFIEIVNDPWLDRPEVNVSILRAAAAGLKCSA